MSITRFDLDMDGSMEPAEHGRWVRFEDHSAEAQGLRGLIDEERLSNDGLAKRLDASLSTPPAAPEPGALTDELRGGIRMLQTTLSAWDPYWGDGKRVTITMEIGELRAVVAALATPASGAVLTDERAPGVTPEVVEAALLLKEWAEARKEPPGWHIAGIGRVK